METTQTTSEERFVVGFALLAGLALFLWLIPGSYFKSRSTASAPSADPTPAAATQWTDPALPDAATSRIDDLEGRLAGIDDELKAKLELLQGQAESTAVILRTEIEGRTHELSELRIRLAELEKTVGQAESPARADLIQRIRFLEIQLGRLRKDTAQSRLFVQDGADLGGKASTLFGVLTNIGEAPPTAVAGEYEKIRTELSAVPVLRVKYDLAASDVPQADRPSLERLAAESPEGTFFLVAGYADKTGDPSANRVLSSKRASNAAEILDRKLQPGQTARAIYLGQTSRFGPDEENRVVEIWAIRP